MSERGILFNTSLVPKLIDGSKTITRRMVKWPVLSKSDGVKRRVLTEKDASQINEWLASPGKHPTMRIACPYGVEGDLLWVRETWIEGFETGEPGKWTCLRPDTLPGVKEENGRAFYLADGGDPPDEAQRPWRPSIHMPRWASRITLQIDEVRVERLQEITSEDIAAEGIGCRTHPKCGSGCAGRRYAFADKWNELHGAGSWDSNCWVWRIAFHRVEQKAEVANGR